MRVLFLFLGLFFLGCQEPELNKTNKVIQKVEQTKQNKYSNWIERENKVPLTIVIGYIDSDIKNTKEYKRLKNMLLLMSNNPKIFNQYFGFDLTEKFYPITIKAFNDEYIEKFNAIYNYKDKDKKILSDMLRNYNNQKYAEIFITINPEKLKQGILELEGYKAIKTEKPLNVSFFKIQNSQYRYLDEKKQKEALINMFLTEFELSIPNYVSLRKKVVYNIKMFKKIASKRYSGMIYNVIDNDGDNNKNFVIYFPFTKRDVKVLIKHQIITPDEATNLTQFELKKIMKIFDRDFLNPAILAMYPNLIQNLTNSDIKYKDGYLIIDKSRFDLDKVFTTNVNTDIELEKKYQNSRFISRDLETGVAYKIVDYFQFNSNINNVELRFNNNELTTIKPYSSLDLVTGNDLLFYNFGVETVRYSDGKFRFAYSKKDDVDTRILFYPVGKSFCKSEFFYRPIFTNLFVVPVTTVFTLGVMTGTNYCEYDEDLMLEYIKKVGVRNLNIFESEL